MRGVGEVHVLVSAELVGCCATCEDQPVVAVRKLRENEVKHHLDAVRELHRFEFNPSSPSALYLRKIVGDKTGEKQDCGKQLHGGTDSNGKNRTSSGKTSHSFL